MVIVTTFASDDHYTIHHYIYPRFEVVRLTTIVVSITKFNNHYHVVISKIVNITLFCSDVHYTVFTVCPYLFVIYSHIWLQIMDGLVLPWMMLMNPVNKQ